MSSTNASYREITDANDRVYRVGAALEALLAQQWGGRLLDQAPPLPSAEPVETTGGAQA